MTKPASVTSAVPALLRRFGPPPWVKWLVSAVIVVHFITILTAVTAAGTSQFPAPYLAIKANVFITRPYLQLTFLTNPYRFYAPNPGPPNMLWVRMRYEDGTVRWLELPRRQEMPTRMTFQRYLSLVMLFDQLYEMDYESPDPSARKMNYEGRVVIASYVRHMAREHVLTRADGTPNRVKEFQFFNIYHNVLQPWQVQKGWDIDDLRTYTPYYYGTFDADGKQLDSTKQIEHRVVSEVAAQWLISDIYPVFKQNPETDRMRLMEEMDVPLAIRALLLKFPNLASPDLWPHDSDLRQKIEEFVLSEKGPEKRQNTVGTGTGGAGHVH